MSQRSPGDRGVSWGDAPKPHPDPFFQLFSPLSSTPRSSPQLHQSSNFQSPRRREAFRRRFQPVVPPPRVGDASRSTRRFVQEAVDGSKAILSTNEMAGKTETSQAEVVEVQTMCGQPPANLQRHGGLFPPEGAAATSSLVRVLDSPAPKVTSPPVDIGAGCRRWRIAAQNPVPTFQSSSHPLPSIRYTSDLSSPHGSGRGQTICVRLLQQNLEMVLQIQNFCKQRQGGGIQFPQPGIRDYKLHP
jgi:hypothetical protein